jgi:glycosyltransferase involved in cell wall biosynthesis
MNNISVIVICKNAAETIERALNSVMEQSIAPLDIVAVVAPSEDHTMEILTSRDSIRIHEQHGKGIGDARNIGISMASGRYVAFLDADDEWLPNSLELQVAALETDSNVMYAVGHLVKIGPDGAEQSESIPALTPGGCLFNAEAFSSVGKFATDLSVAADHEWFLRARQNGVKHVIHDGLVLRKHIHGKNESVTRRQLYRMEVISLLRGRK